MVQIQLGSRARSWIWPAFAGGGAVCALLSGLEPALAQNPVQIRSVIAERLLFDDNIRLAPDSDGWVFGSDTSVDVGIARRTPRETIRLDLGGDVNRFTGPGASDDLNSVNWDAALGYDKRSARARLNGRAGYRRRAVNQTQLDDTGATGGGGRQNTKFVRLGLDYEMTSADTAATNAQFRDVTFDGTDGTTRNPFRAASLSGEWAHRFTPRETGTALVEGTYFEADDPGSTTSQAITVGLAYERRESPRLTLRAGGGLGAGIETTGSGAARDTSISPIFALDLSAIYNLRRISIDVSVFQGVEPSAGGSLQQRRVARARLSYRWTRFTNLELVASHTDFYDSFQTLPFANTSRRYSTAESRIVWQLAESWDLTTAYRFQHDNDSAGRAISNSVFATLSYRATLLP